MSIGSRSVWREETLDTNFYSLSDKGIFVLDIGKCLYIGESFYVLTVKKRSSRHIERLRESSPL